MSTMKFNLKQETEHNTMADNFQTSFVPYKHFLINKHCLMGKHRKQTFLHRHMHTERQHIELLLKGQTFKGYCCYLFVAPNVAPIIFARSCQYHTKSVWTLKSLRSGGGSFFTSADFGRMFYHSFPACAFFSFFFLKWRLARTHLFHCLC